MVREVNRVVRPGERGVVDAKLSDLIDKQGGYSTKLSWKDREKLRFITRKVHMRNYPGHLLTDLECDKMIDAIAPNTAEYLVKVHLENASAKLRGKA